MIEAGGEKVIAKVIVDVPLMQTDKPYSYQDCSRCFRRGRHKRGIKSDCGGLGLHSGLKSRAVLVGRSITKKCFFL